MSNPPLKIDLIASAAKLAASGQAQMTGDMRGDDTIKRLIPERDLPGISDEEADPVRIRAGILTKR